MNAATLATLLPVAIGLALSPAALIQLILVLFSKRRVVNSIAFVGSLLVLSAAALALGGFGAAAAGEQPDQPDSPVVSIVLALFGLLLLVVGAKNWRNRADTSEPAAMAAIANMGPGAVALLSLGATFVNPKNLPLLISAGATTAGAGSPLLTGGVFLLIATAPYTLAMVYSLAGGERAAAQLDRVRGWLVTRNRLIMGVICLLLGLVLLVKGVTALL